MNLYLNGVSAPSVSQCVFFIHVNFGAMKELYVDVYSGMHIRKRRQKFVIYQYCVEYCTLAGLYDFLHTAFRVLVDTFCF